MDIWPQNFGKLIGLFNIFATTFFIFLSFPYFQGWISFVCKLILLVFPGLFSQTENSTEADSFKNGDFNSPGRAYGRNFETCIII